MDELSPEDKLAVARARKIQRFLSQPFHVARSVHGQPGQVRAAQGHDPRLQGDRRPASTTTCPSRRSTWSARSRKRSRRRRRCSSADMDERTMAATMHIDVVSAEGVDLLRRGGIRGAAGRGGRARHLSAPHAADHADQGRARCASRCRARPRKSWSSCGRHPRGAARPRQRARGHRDPRRGPRRGQGARGEAGGGRGAARAHARSRESRASRPSSRPSRRSCRRSRSCARPVAERARRLQTCGSLVRRLAGCSLRYNRRVWPGWIQKCLSASSSSLPARASA